MALVKPLRYTGTTGSTKLRGIGVANRCNKGCIWRFRACNFPAYTRLANATLFKTKLWKKIHFLGSLIKGVHCVRCQIKLRYLLNRWDLGSYVKHLYFNRSRWLTQRNICSLRWALESIDHAVWLHSAYKDGLHVDKFLFFSAYNATCALMDHTLLLCRNWQVGSMES